jgi:cytochrome c oxidase subunit II
MLGTRARRWLTWGAAALGCGALTGCAEQPATSQAQQIHSLYYLILALAGLVFLGVEGTLLWSIIRYRRRPGDEAEPPQRYGTTKVIVLFFLIGLVIVAALYPFGEVALTRVDSNPPPGEEVDIQGSQWQWSAVYPNEGIAVSGKTFVRPLVMEVPVDEPIRIRLISNDVMHELFVPNFFFMRNALPGRTNVFTWTPTELGTFQGQCAEYCGLGHYQMRFVVRVVTQQDFVAWVNQVRKAALSVTCPQMSGTQLRVAAHNISWNTQCIHVAAGTAISLTVSNLDAGIDHNFAIWNGPDTKHEFFQTSKFPGVATRSFTIQALPPGKYYYQCNVHGPAMSGVFIVGNPKRGRGG